jgi:hypothetical protein
MEYISPETIRCMYEKENKDDVARSFHWQVLLAVLNNELHVEHDAHGVMYKFQDLEKFLHKWWPQSEGS